MKILLENQNNKCFFCDRTNRKNNSFENFIVLGKEVAICQKCSLKADVDKFLPIVLNRICSLYGQALESFEKDMAMKAFRKELQNYNREQTAQNLKGK